MPSLYAGISDEYILLAFMQDENSNMVNNEFMEFLGVGGGES